MIVDILFIYLMGDVWVAVGRIIQENGRADLVSKLTVQYERVYFLFQPYHSLHSLYGYLFNEIILPLKYNNRLTTEYVLSTYSY